MDKRKPKNHILLNIKIYTVNSRTEAENGGRKT
jgi:hypothetical protein